MSVIIGCGGGGGGGGGSTPLNSTLSGYVFVPAGAGKQSQIKLKNITPPVGMIPLVGATVRFSDGSRSTTTNNDGYYSLRTFVNSGKGGDKTLEVWMDAAGNEKLTFQARAKSDKYTVSSVQIQGSAGNRRIKQVITPPPADTSSQIETQITTIIGETFEFSGLSSATDVGVEGKVELTWTTPTHSDSPISYKIYVAAGTGEQDFSEEPSATATNTSSTDISGLENDTYYVVARAYTSSGRAEDTPNTVEKTVTVTQNQSPVITLTDPTGGENWSGNQEITWVATDPDDDPLTVDIYTSDDGGTSWNILVSDEEDDGSYTWDTTGVGNGSNYRIKVEVSDGVKTGADKSDDNFTVQNNQAPTITLTTPTGGENWSGNQNITWVADDPDDDTLTIDIGRYPTGPIAADPTGNYLYVLNGGDDTISVIRIYP